MYEGGEGIEESQVTEGQESSWYVNTIVLIGVKSFCSTPSFQVMCLNKLIIFIIHIKIKDALQSKDIYKLVLSKTLINITHSFFLGAIQIDMYMTSMPLMIIIIILA